LRHYGRAEALHEFGAARGAVERTRFFRGADRIIHVVHDKAA